MKADADVYPQLAVRTCRRFWLRIKLHFLVERDEKGLEELKQLLDATAGKRIEIAEFMLAIRIFCKDDDSGLITMIFAHLCVPFWQWRRLHRVMEFVDLQLSD